MAEIKVNTENMHEFNRALKTFEDELENFSKDINNLTVMLSSAMDRCSRYGDIKNEVKKSRRSIDEKLQNIHNAAADIHARAMFLEDFERGIDVPVGRRRIDSI